MSSIVDTIIAQVTPPGRSGVSILRISGSKAPEICLMILKKIPKPRYASFLDFFSEDDFIVDKGIALWFPAPVSFTGEDILELQGHGNPVITDLIIKRVLTIPGVRIAGPGEFSKRAFLNNKIDLIQAEAISDLINADSEQSVRSSLKSMAGEFSLYITKVLKKINVIRTTIESVINFEEDDDVSFIDKIDIRIQDVISCLKQTQKIASQGHILREGLKVAIVGPVNSGKSSLLNALSFRDSSIVTDIAGTTRDVLREFVNINGVTFCFSDTAGLRSTNNEIELIGIEKTHNEIKNSDHILLVIDCSISKREQHKIFLDFMQNKPEDIPITVILNKSDLINDKIGIYVLNNVNCIFLSAIKKIGFDLFYKYLTTKLLWNKKDNESIFIARRRHLDNLKECLLQLLEGQKIWKNYKNIELLAENLKLAQFYLSKTTGEFTSEDLLENIFSSFCIGK